MNEETKVKETISEISQEIMSGEKNETELQAFREELMLKKGVLEEIYKKLEAEVSKKYHAGADSMDLEVSRLETRIRDIEWYLQEGIEELLSYIEPESKEELPEEKEEIIEPLENEETEYFAVAQEKKTPENEPELSPEEATEREEQEEEERETAEPEIENFEETREVVEEDLDKPMSDEPFLEEQQEEENIPEREQPELSQEKEELKEDLILPSSEIPYEPSELEDFEKIIRDILESSSSHFSTTNVQAIVAQRAGLTIPDATIKGEKLAVGQETNLAKALGVNPSEGRQVLQMEVRDREREQQVRER